jgi:hypothetical protein
VAHFVNETQDIAQIDAASELLTILESWKWNDFDGIATEDQSWLRYFYLSSGMFTQSPENVSPRTRQAIRAENTMLKLFFTAKKLIFLDVLPKDQKLNHLQLLCK